MITASINARMGSTRLPGKALADIGGQPLLSLLLHRLRKAKTLDKIVLATTTFPEDDVLLDWADDVGLPVFRGSELDVLERTVEANAWMGSDIVVRVCGDTPLIDPDLVDRAVQLVERGTCDIAMSAADRKYPHGVSAHVCKMSDLEHLHETLSDPVLREHVTLHLYESGEYKVHKLQGKPEWDCEGQRLQVDYKEDLEVVRLIISRLGVDCSLGDIVALLRREPWIRGINELCEETVIR